MFVLIVIWALVAATCFVCIPVAEEDLEIGKSVAIAIFWPLVAAYYIARGVKDLINAAIEKW